MPIDDGGVKIVDLQILKSGFRAMIWSEHDYIRNGTLPQAVFTLPYEKLSTGEIRDPRETFELFAMNFDMLPTWSWNGYQGQFAHVKNYKCSDNFSITRHPGKAIW